jgi:DNA processing protein
LSDLIKILQIINTEGIGPVTFYKLMQKSADDIDAALDLLATKKKVFSRDEAESIVEKAQKIGARIITYQDNEYPESLRQLNDAPPVIYALGNVNLLKHPATMAIVGARNASIGGRKMASHIAYDLTENDVLVISGMARGIDCAAHKGALYAKNKQGPTIAVLGTGVDEIYPPENKDVYYQIAEQGLLISEFPLGTAAQISNFPRRNRIIAALSAGTLVVEAGIHSGSLITAQQALEQGKEIFAVPGSPIESRSAGPNHLIKQGAILTENADDILNVLSITQNRQIKNYQLELKGLDKPENKANISEHKIEKQMTVETPAEKVPLLELISYEGVDIDELLRNSGYEQADFFMQILDLEFAGKIERQVGNKVARIK